MKPDRHLRRVRRDIAPIRGATMANFLYWLASYHPEVERLEDQSEEFLLQLINEFEEGKLDRNEALKKEWMARIKNLRDTRSSKEELDMKLTMVDFEEWLGELLKVEPQANEKDIDLLLHEYLNSKNRKDIDRYIGSLKSLQDGRVYEELTEQLVQMGVKPKVGKQRPPTDILERYRAVPLHAIFLYTSEDRSIASYISEHWGALDALSGDYCDMHPSVDQFRNAEDAYDFIEKLDVVRASKFNAYSQLPCLFFWDNQGASDYISFGLKPTLANIREIVRVVFEEIRKSPTISSVARAKNLLSKKKNSSEIKEEVSKKSGIWRDLSAILIAFIIVIVVLAVISRFVSAIALGVVLIAALLFFVLIAIWLLRRAGQLSESNFTRLVNRFFDALPLLREKLNKDKGEREKS